MNIKKQSLPTQNTIPGFLQGWLSKSIRHKLARCEIILQQSRMHFFILQELLQLINSEQVLVISGETGCGKTTQVWTVQFWLICFIFISGQCFGGVLIQCTIWFLFKYVLNTDYFNGYIYFFQVAQFILDDAIEQGHGSLCRIICTQPRRISAISVCFLSVPHLLIYITLQARCWQ